VNLPLQRPVQRIEIEPEFAPRLESEQPLVLIPPPIAERGSVGTIFAGACVLGVGFAGLETANFVVDQFNRSPWLGGITLGVAVAGFGLLGAGIWRELRGLLGLGRVDRIRAAMGSGQVGRARHAARQWLGFVSEGQDILPAIEQADSVDAIHALLRAGPLSALRVRTDTLARTAAIQSFVAASAIPSAWLDGLFMLWRGLRLVRQVAELHGLRPGTLGTLALLRRSAFTAGAVITTDVAVNTALGAIGTHPLLRHIAGDVAGAGVGARRLFLLARATAVACAPLEP
jgi:uncharacterized membrane protein YcjF (UPF0283 family)